MKCITPIIFLPLIVACSTNADPGTSSQPLRVDTTSGPVVAEVDATVVSWRDIPYAQPPVGELRWRAPRPMESPSPL